MYKAIKTYITAILIYICYINSLYAYSNLKFERIKGLTNPSAICIHQDSYGFIWIGTWNGLNRYDGYKFKYYYSISGDSKTLSSPGITAIVEDKQQRLWLACTNALNYYDRKKDRFYHFYNNPNDTTSIIGNDLNCLYIDSRGRLWVGTYSNGLCYANVNNLNNYSETSPVFKRFFHNPQNPNSISSNYIRSIYEDSEGKIWIIASNRYIDCFDEKNNNFIHFSIENSLIYSQSEIIELYYDNPKTADLWFITKGAGIFSWNKHTHKITHYHSKSNTHYLSFDIIRHIWPHPDGTLWVATDGGGLSIIDYQKGEIKKYNYDINIPESISSDAIYRIFCDNNGQIWFTTFNGELSKFHQLGTVFTHIKPTANNYGLNHKYVLSFLNYNDDELWIGTDGGGINIYNLKTKSFKYIFKSDLPEGLSSNAIICMDKDKEGKVWIGTYGGGLNCYDPKSKTVKKYLLDIQNPNSIKENDIWTLAIDKHNKVYCVTLTGILEIYDPKKNKFYHYQNNPGASHNYFIAYPTKTIIDSRNWLWITTTQGVLKLDLNKYNDPEKQAYHFEIFKYHPDKNSIPSNNVYAIAEDKDGNIWLGTDEGWLSKYDVKYNYFYNYTDSIGLINRGIRSMIFDENNNLWFGTTHGLWRFNPATKHFIQYLESDGLQSNFFSQAITKLSNGQICVGGINGFNLFDPNAIPINNKPPNIVITELYVMNKPVKAGETINNHVILPVSIETAHEIFLPYNTQFFAIEFSALDFINPSKNRYAYKLEGFDKKWIYTTADNRTAMYANLKPGTYIFKVKGSNNDRVWNAQPKKLVIHIVPPWWHTWWFRTSIIIFFIGGLVIYLHQRSIQYKKREEELNTIVLKRTQELVETNNQLQEQKLKFEKQTEELKQYSKSLSETNVLLLEKQKIILEQAEQLQKSNEQLHLLNASKDKFFSIIAHDLRNPFNVLIGLSDIMYRNYDKLAPEKIKRYSEIISLSAKSGYALLENLLQWSRSQTGNITFTPTKIILSLVVEEIIDLHAAAIERKGIQIVHNINPSLTVFADESMLMTILRNLISNAIKFTHEKGSVTISAQIINNEVQVAISDTGIGIPKKELNNLFRIDVNYSTKGTSNETGTGLGLILCKEFIDKHGGKIWVESEENKGSTFYFTLPTTS